jgi:hypothetical protein
VPRGADTGSAFGAKRRADLTVAFVDEHDGGNVLPGFGLLEQPIRDEDDQISWNPEAGGGAIQLDDAGTAGSRNHIES